MALKISDDVIDTDRAPISRIFNAIKPLSVIEARILRIAEADIQNQKLLEESHGRAR